MKAWWLLSIALLAPGIVSGQTLPTELIYSYSVPTPSATTGYAKNGNLLSYTDSVNGTWSMQYDSLNRISSATPTAGPYQSQVLGWDYDSFGNRKDQTVSTVSGPSPALVVQSAWAKYDGNNRLTSSNLSPSPDSLTSAFDSSGNLNYDGNNHYLYDAEGRVCASQNGLTSATTQYFYDAEGHRVSKATSGTFSCTLGGPSVTPSATYVLGPSGEQMTEFDETGAWKHTNVFAGGQLQATYDTYGLHFRLSDPLGTVRVQASGAGVAEENFSSLPFGDGLNPTNLLPNGTVQDATEHHFTGKERDTESGLDYFGARYYASNMGRWMSPDWSAKAEPVPYSKLDNPQTLNLYGYVGNNPLSRADADGHQWPTWGEVKTFLGDLACECHEITQAEQSATAARVEKTFQTYTKTNPDTGQVYSGRTSGTGTPEENVAKRDSGHHMNEKGFGPAVPDKSSTNKDAIKGREQQLVDANGGAQSKGGTSGNAINALDPNKPTTPGLIQAAEKEFGVIVEEVEKIAPEIKKIPEP